MSLLHLVSRNIVIKFSETAQYKPEAYYAFRLTGVDGMGFLQIQDLNSEYEATAAPYWINKDLVREIHEIDLATTDLAIQFLGKVKPTPVETPVEQDQLAPSHKPTKKAPSKAKSILKNKPDIS